MKFNKIKILKEKTIEYNSQKIKSGIDIVKYISDLENMTELTEESILLICLNNKNQIIAYSEIAKGGINNCQLDMKTIFKNVLLTNACSFILVHNHPSGDATPSHNDYLVTRKIQETSSLMDIKLLDHIVVGENNQFCSCLSTI